MSGLDVGGLSVTIHGTAVLTDVSFKMAPGEILGLVGESGSGKSMTALALMGLLPRGAEVDGRAVLGKTDLLSLDERAMCRVRGREIGMIFQEPMTALNPLQTIGAQVAEALAIHGGGARGAGELLARVGLDPDRIGPGRYPHELSGGQRQRVAIAIAIALSPRLLVADEPTTALDVTSQAEILDLLCDLVRDEGMGLLLITHDLAVVAGIADRVAVMQEGRIVEAGATEAVFRTRSHPYTRALFAASSHVPKRIAAPSGVPVLTVDGVRRHYPGPRKGLLRRGAPVRAVDGVSLGVGRGESVGLVGESGCGKSTLTRAILGLDALDAGQVALCGDAVMPPVPGEVRRRMQVVFQDPFGSFDPRWRVDRLVAEPFHLTGYPEDWRDKVAHALVAVGLKPRDMEKYIHEFSGGQRQRIAIARAIVIRPDLVILDEAVSALDVRVRAQILDLLADLQGEFGLSYLFISHDLSVVRSITDRVLVMQAGRIVEAGPTERVLAAPEHPYTRRLVAAVPVIPAGWITPQSA
ncbi:ABC transporter ATP-binding protein [Anianabacter salinae]|uniref:ABC transporter ATP-binding protein n=1 Tax=Anianabacter salinae TaxID=2851023 RepID=UPI00225DD702|nr:dipeptide ABC transporter ATP-binding protein [Anianabacter salinae]MBV0912339.1 dipeptide ABC transporter ATP-binding protein [Anianabacter salinae]